MADIKPLNEQPVSDDDELASVLAGVKDEAARLDSYAPPAPVEPVLAAMPPAVSVPVAPLQFEETPVAPIVPPAAPSPALPPTPAYQAAPYVSEPSPSPILTTPVASSPELESLKKDALSELRPLVDKLSLSPEERFDTILLIIRSTDDQSLLGPAHEAAKSIVDETRRAQALLDVIKEIDYFSTKA